MSDYFFPKALLPLRQRPLIFQIIDYWAPVINQVIIVLNGRNEEIVKEYFEKYYRNSIHIDFCIQDKPTGTYFSIKIALQLSTNQELILNWSDVCLRATDLPLMGSSNLIFTTSQVSCRWKFSHGEFIKDTKKKYLKHGIFGIFYIHNKKKFLSTVHSEKQDDEVEVLEAFDGSKFESFNIEEFDDIGDDDKYSLCLRQTDKDSGIRPFGSYSTIIMGNNTVVKNISNLELRESEINWYKHANFSFTPKVISYDPFTLQRLDAISVHEKLKGESSEYIEDSIITELFNVVQKIHLSKKPRKAESDSSFKQYYQSILEKLNKIDFMFSSFNKKEFIINGKLCKNPKDILIKNREIISDIFPDNFMFIHGDYTLSNTLVDTNNKIYVIDPKGTFGNTALYGDPMYDFAKLYYGLCGMYETFSTGDNHQMVLSKNSFEIKPMIEKVDYTRRRRKFIRALEKVEYVKSDVRTIDILHAIIWLSVAEYTANDVLSCMHAYLRGTLMINDIFSLS